MLQVVNPIKNALQQGWKNLPKKRIASFVGMFLFCAVATYASSKGAGGFTKATTEISSYQTPVANLMKAIAAVIVLVGAFNVYFKMQNGDQDVKKTIMGGSSHVLQVKQDVTEGDALAIVFRQQGISFLCFQETLSCKVITTAIPYSKGFSVLWSSWESEAGSLAMPPEPSDCRSSALSCSPSSTSSSAADSMPSGTTGESSSIKACTIIKATVNGKQEKTV